MPTLLFAAAGCTSNDPTAASTSDAAASDARGVEDAADAADSLTQSDAAPPDASKNLPIGWADACAPLPAAGDFPTDVGAVIQQRCQSCHQKPPKNHAPFPLLAYEDILKADSIDPYRGEPIWKVMHIVIQPGAVPHMPLGNATPLTPAEMQTLDGWLTACPAPVAEGTGADLGETTDAGIGDAASD